MNDAAPNASKDQTETPAMPAWHAPIVQKMSLEATLYGAGSLPDAGSITGSH